MVGRFVYVSSAGVTRPGKPGINIDEEPPAVRMNDMLGGILTYKLKAEDELRVGVLCSSDFFVGGRVRIMLRLCPPQASGVPYTVIRPCALTEEAAGAPMLVSQGDTIKVDKCVPEVILSMHHD